LVDFRYHALSLVAVFLALGIGIVLGVTVGDSLVSEADQNLRDSLRDDVTEAREDARNEQELGTRRDEVIDETSQAVAEGRLRGTDVAVVAIGSCRGRSRIPSRKRSTRPAGTSSAPPSWTRRTRRLRRARAASSESAGASGV
jgi:predicted phage gp36 major capsid-like protein